MFKILGYLKPYTKQLVVCVLLLVVKMACDLLMPYLMTSIINDGVQNGDINLIVTNGGIMVGVAAVSLVLFLLQQWKLNKIATSYAADMRKRVFDKVESLTFEQFNSIGNASLQSRSTEDTHWLQDMVMGMTFAIVTVPLMTIGGSIFAFLINPLLALIILAAIPVLVVLLIFLGKFIRPLMQKASEHTDAMTKTMRERLIGIRVIRAFNKEEYEHQRFHKSALGFSVNVIKNNTAFGILQPVMNFVLNIITLLIVFFGSRMVVDSNGAIGAGEIIALIQYVVMIMGGMAMCGFIVAIIPRVQNACRRINEVLDMEVVSYQTPTDSSDTERVAIDGRIEFKNLTFYYDKESKEPCLSNINMTMQPRSTVAILGGTGSGKSTIAKLLLGFYDATEGEILLNGKNINSYDIKAVRDNIAYISQNSVLFEGTIATNVRLGKLDATDDEVREALKISQIDEFVNSQPEGINYPLNDSGGNLSGGQKQRISIARAIVRKSPIYIFDDSFSALDFKTDASLRKQLKVSLADSLVIIITQRISTALTADKIYVLNKGELVGEGRHDSLLKTCDIYKQLAKLQMGLEEANG